MSNNKRPLIPFFLQKIDASLLRNKPAVWQTRTHLVLFFSAVFALLLSLFCLLVFFDARQYSAIEGWVMFTSLIAFIGLVFWLIFLLRFNVFKRFGNWQTWDGLKNFLLYFICTGAIVAVCFIPSAMESFRANRQFSNEEIVKDINEVNATACKLEYDILPKVWKADTCRIVDTVINRVYVDTEAYADTAIAAGVPQPYHTIDTTELRVRLLSNDSTIKLHDTLYVFFECPNYRFVNSYYADEYTQQKLLTSAQIYHSVIKPYVKNANRALLVNRIKELKTKWGVNDRYGSYYDNVVNEDDVYELKIQKKYELTKISNGIDNVVRKKYSWIKDWEVYVRVFYYITLSLTLLVFVFRHSTTKTFFLSVLTAVVFFIITGLALLTGYNSEESTVLSLIIFYYVLFGGVAASVFAVKTRSAIQGIALNLFVVMTPFIPLVIAGLHEIAYRNNRYYNTVYVNIEPHNSALHYFLAEVAGAVLLLLLLQFLFNKLYRRWFAAPEN